MRRKGHDIEGDREGLMNLISHLRGGHNVDGLEKQMDEMVLEIEILILDIDLVA